MIGKIRVEGECSITSRRLHYSTLHMYMCTTLHTTLHVHYITILLHSGKLTITTQWELYLSHTHTHTHIHVPLRELSFEIMGSNNVCVCV